MRTIRAVVADDERVIVRGLRKLLQWDELGIEIVGEAYDGRGVQVAVGREQLGPHVEPSGEHVVLDGDHREADQPGKPAFTEGVQPLDDTFIPRLPHDRRG